MKTSPKKLAWLLSSLIFVAIGSAGAQITGNETPDAVQEEVEAASDAQRVRRIREAIELDRVRLEQARADQPQRQELFDLLAEGIAAWKADQQEKRLRLEKTGDPEERASLEREISKLDDDLELLRAQSEQVFSALTIVRQQIQVLEKKIEREQRTVNVLLGAAPEVTKAAPLDSAPDVGQPATWRFSNGDSPPLPHETAEALF